MENLFNLRGTLPANGLAAGYHITQGIGQHITRTIDSYEIIYVKAGTLGIFEEGIQFDVKAGQSLILFPGRLHGGTRQFDKDLCFYWLHFTEKKEALTCSPLCSLPQLIQVEKPDRFVELMRKYIKSKNDLYMPTDQLNLILMEIFLNLYSSSFEQQSLGKIQILATKAQEYIRLHLKEEITTSIISRHLDCNPDYLGRVYTKTYNKTLTQGIQEQRMREACNLLIETTLQINQIADLCGYSDSNRFRRTFKHVEGISPKEYRQKYCIVSL